MLKVENLRTSSTTDVDSAQFVRGTTFRVGKGGSLGIVGESGCGKGVTVLSIMGLLEDNASRQAGTLLFDGKDLPKKFPKEMRKIQGNRIDMMLQDPITSPNSLLTVGEQIQGPLIRHQKLSRKEAEAKALAVLEAVGLPNPECRLKQHPHELLGGTCRKVMIAIAVCCKPELLIANEPTTALDAAIQAQTPKLMAHTRSEFNTSAVLIAYDLGVIPSLCTRVIVMYGGLIIEEGNIEDVFYRAGHPYTAGLPISTPKRIEEKLIPIFGTPPDFLNPPEGCLFAARCSHAMKLCVIRQPPPCDLSDGYISACWLHNESVKARMGEVKL